MFTVRASASGEVCVLDVVGTLRLPIINRQLPKIEPPLTATSLQRSLVWWTSHTLNLV